MGVTFLPIRSFGAELSSGKLHVVATDPPMAKVPFSATMLVNGTQPLADIVASLAVTVSDFQKLPA
jgi:hypothetical protein